jgi:hypothetical protein
VDDPEDSGLAADGPKKIGAEKRCAPSLPTRKRKLSNVMSIASPRLAYVGKQAGGWGTKSTRSGWICLPPSTALLAADDDEDAIKIRTLLPQLPIDGANWRGFNSSMPTDCRLRVSWNMRVSRSWKLSDEQRRLTRKFKMVLVWWITDPLFDPWLLLYIRGEAKAFRVVQVVIHRVGLDLSIY